MRIVFYGSVVMRVKYEAKGKAIALSAQYVMPIRTFTQTLFSTAFVEEECT
jgi:hypothetical protein